MAVYQVAPGDLITMTAETDLTGKENTVVKFSGTTKDFQVTAATAATDLIAGVLHKGGAAGSMVTVQVSGIAKVISAGSIDQGAPVVATTAGEIVTGAGAAVGLKYIVGFALEDAVDNDVISVLVKPVPYNTSVS